MVNVADGPGPEELRRWRRHLANELAEAAVYRDLALKHEGEERAIRAAIAAAEERHEQHWLTLLRPLPARPLPARALYQGLSTRATWKF